MPAQGSAASNVHLLDAGNCLIEVAPLQSSLSNAKAFTGWKKLGLTSGASQLDMAVEKLQWTSGMPSAIVQEVISSASAGIQGNLSEYNPLVVQQLLGGLTPTVVLKSSSPSPTTVAASPSPTATGFTVASAAGFAVNDLIQVGTGGSAQYGYISAIATNALTIRDGLSGNTAPASSAAVSAVQSYTLAFGNQSVIQPVSLRVTKQIAASSNTGIAIYILKASPSGGTSFSFSDDQAPDKTSFPFSFTALKDAAVEGGNISFMEWTF